MEPLAAAVIREQTKAKAYDESNMSSLPRREFLATGAATSAALTAGMPTALGAPIDSGTVTDAKINHITYETGGI